MPSAGDIIEAADVEIAGISLGMITWTTQSSNGTTTSSGTETRDAVLGNITFVVAAAQNNTRYRVVLAGRGLNVTAAADRFTLNFRDGGNATPTASSAQWGVNFNMTFTATGSPGVAAGFFASTAVPGTGTHTLSAFWVRTSGTGTATPTGACEFYVEALGG